MKMLVPFYLLTKPLSHVGTVDGCHDASGHDAAGVSEMHARG